MSPYSDPRARHQVIAALIVLALALTVPIVGALMGADYARSQHAQSK